MYGYGFLSRGFPDRREILHGGSAISQTGLLLFWGDSPRVHRVLSVNSDLSHTHFGHGQPSEG